MIYRAQCHVLFVVLGFFAPHLGTGSTCLAQKTLAWKFSTDQVIDVVLDQDTKMKLNGLPSAPLNESNTIQRTEMTWRVLKPSTQGAFVVEQSIERILFEMKSVSDNFVIDTKDSKPLTGRAEFMAKEIRPLAGSKFVVTSKATGEVVDLTFPNASAGGTANNSLAETGLREIAANSSLRLPSNPIQVGETWQNEYELDMRLFGKLIVSTTYQYLGEEIVNGKTLDKIKASTANRAADPSSKSGLKLTKQESAGTIWFDNQRGCIDHSEFQQEMALDVLQAGQQIKQDVKQTYKLKF
ncbi:MAG: hypothetical protein ABL921_04835, partial [Pirellula sp.]